MGLQCTVGLSQSGFSITTLSGKPNFKILKIIFKIILFGIVTLILAKDICKFVNAVTNLLVHLDRYKTSCPKILRHLALSNLPAVLIVVFVQMILPELERKAESIKIVLLSWQPEMCYSCVLKAQLILSCCFLSEVHSGLPASAVSILVLQEMSTSLPSVFLHLLCLCD